VSENSRPIEVGDRFEDKDPRQGNRVVRVVSVEHKAVHAFAWAEIRVTVEVAELNPKTIGRTYRIAPNTLHERYKRVSR
jgi:hypothetical protein